MTMPPRRAGQSADRRGLEQSRLPYAAANDRDPHGAAIRRGFSRSLHRRARIVWV